MANRYDNRITITTPKGKERLETNRAWEYFCYYRDMEKRSYQRVADHFGRSKKAIEEVAKKYDWQNRIAEMVDDEQKKKKKEKLRKKRATIKRHRDTGKKAQEDIQALINDIRTNTMLSEDEKAKAIAPLYNQLFKAIEVERTANHLPKQYNDKQKVEAETQVTGDLNISQRFLFKDKESYHKKISDELEDLLE